MNQVNILYIHGMGGGTDSRIPTFLKDILPHDFNVVVRIYDFNPELASEQISQWVEEIRPSLVIGESLGSLHAMCIRDVPHIFVSPAINAPLYFHFLSYLSYIPGITWLFDRIYRPREGDRQKVHFTSRNLRGYRKLRQDALKNSAVSVSKDYFHAFIGRDDHYRRSGVVSVRTWTKYFPDSLTMYEGSHYMEEEPLRTLLVPAIMNLLK